ncbi:hypothetical protein H5A20_13625 [Pectobacterium brasiliense]|uniref:hypothetical protein n=1 Tax=Pectobacterium brasiliense TaxID=180957 RepID=UPI001968E57C|nr:hypothetical protein [Pectobacterium brasiliense]MBN3199744.1 hypothetical protein [Pectobacterium brasiliense]
MIYHYTDLRAAKSIAENSTVWLTECRYLNDKEEFTTGLELLRKAVELHDEYFPEYPIDFIKCIKKAKKHIRLIDLKSPLAVENLFVASFSDTSDSLSQWRSYGMFMLAFDQDFISQSLIEDDFYCLKCHYARNTDEAIKYAISIVGDVIIPELLRKWKRENMNLMDLWFLELIEIYALSFKNVAFESESETRLVIACKNDDPVIKFRVKGDLLIPYIALEINPCSLMSITVGPIANQDLSVASLKLFANITTRQVRTRQNENNYCLYVKSSDIPYRNL